MDISGLIEANEYDLPVTVSVSKSGVETNYVNPGKVHVRVDRVESKDVPVEVNVTARRTTATAQASRPRATKKVTVSGPATDLAQVSKAVAAVDVTGRNSSLADYECRVTLYDQDGAAFTSNYITSQNRKDQGFGSDLPRQQHSADRHPQGRRQPDSRIRYSRHRPRRT